MEVYWDSLMFNKGVIFEAVKRAIPCFVGDTIRLIEMYCIGNRNGNFGNIRHLFQKYKTIVHRISDKYSDIIRQSLILQQQQKQQQQQEEEEHSNHSIERPKKRARFLKSYSSQNQQHQYSNQHSDQDMDFYDNDEFVWTSYNGERYHSRDQYYFGGSY